MRVRSTLPQLTSTTSVDPGPVHSESGDTSTPLQSVQEALDEAISDARKVTDSGPKMDESSPSHGSGTFDSNSSIIHDQSQDVAESSELEQTH
ncbi:hypothetical protein SERLA73DRAFT_134769 [Serpula lacrymans var. lacrymans S7.3]|uniref:Uncharacterized protein n=1 Tax=Serpula lacrymans var. lacrymans (strain S7.3) TaxID=936435 RepID=F8PVG9_SERL3|nr:hypothetical protein SERLA73DRAFT_134769 [Serpula lacrymans var. lacrymans S7.3]